MKLLFYKNDDCTTSDCSFKYKISRQTTTSMSLANYKRSFRINECIEIEDARKILKSDFFQIEKSGSKNLEDGPNENAIEICCPAYSVWKSYFDQNKIVEPNSTKAGFQIHASDWLMWHRFYWPSLKTLLSSQKSSKMNIQNALAKNINFLVTTKLKNILNYLWFL